MILAKKEWTLEEAEMALKVERELDKSSNPSLVIRFPDLELNEQIVMKLHPAIETVKIQQSKPRFCFVSLKVKTLLGIIYSNSVVANGNFVLLYRKRRIQTE